MQNSFTTFCANNVNDIDTQQSKNNSIESGLSFSKVKLLFKQQIFEGRHFSTY